MNNRTCFIMRGAPGCGKSYRAKEIAIENDAVIVSADDYWMINGKYVFDVSRLGEAHAQCYRLFTEAVANGQNVIVDNTNLNYKDMIKYINHLVLHNDYSDVKYSIELVNVQYNDIDTAIKLRSNKEDGKNIPENVMRRMWKQFKEDVRGRLLSDYKGKIGLGELDNIKCDLPWPKPVEGLPNAILCDLDGTLAIFEYMSGIKIRSPYDAAKADKDFICNPVAMAITGFCRMGVEVIFVSGRSSEHRAPSVDFLNRASKEYGFTYDKLYMRHKLDSRADSIVKQEIYEEHLKGKYNILAVFDDRNSVVKMWRENGLYVFNCNYRGEEF